MYRALVVPLVFLVLHVQPMAAAHAQACVADQHGDLVCGEGKVVTNPVVVHPNALGERHLARRTMRVLHLG